jgi:hypothetical protein
MGLFGGGSDDGGAARAAESNAQIARENAEREQMRWDREQQLIRSRQEEEKLEKARQSQLAQKALDEERAKKAAEEEEKRRQEEAKKTAPPIEFQNTRTAKVQTLANAGLPSLNDPKKKQQTTGNQFMGQSNLALSSVGGFNTKDTGGRRYA